VVLLGGFVAVWVAVWCLVASTRTVSAPVSLIAVSVVLVAYVIVLGLRRDALHRLPLPKATLTWLSMAVDEDEDELASSIRPSRGRPVDAVVAVGALIVVVLSSVAMERGASTLGHHFHVADAVVGGIALAVVTSLPNAVAGVHLANKGRGAAALSTTFTSNNLNVIAGLLIPGTLIGLAAPSFSGNLTAASYLALTALVLVLAFAYRGLGRGSGWLIICGYAAFVVWLFAVT
jgi:cation:H+ antiporter